MFGPWAAYFPVSLCQESGIVTLLPQVYRAIAPLFFYMTFSTSLKLIHYLGAEAEFKGRLGQFFLQPRGGIEG